MKKILARLAQSDSDDGVSPYNSLGVYHSSHHSSIGRRFTVGNFTLTVEDIIAEGGFGVVFRVRSQHDHLYALKRTCVNNDLDLSACKREVTIVSSLSHKNIIRYVDSRIASLQPGIHEILLLTAFYPGSLIQLLSERKQHQQRLTEVEVLRVFCDICEAVHRLHHCKTPIIHRDLKVENILIDEKRNFVLCDFGSATSRVLHPEVHGLSRCEEEIAKYTTLSYRAPEMVNLYSSIPLGPQIDIWALGCLLYCLCFLILPFGESALAIQSGNYTIPDISPYSERLHKLIGYILCIDAFKRPDIYQVCALTFSLAGRTNPVQNLNNLSVPHWKDLTVPKRESEPKFINPAQNIANGAPDSSRSSLTPTRNVVSNQNLDGSISTTVAPRERPRASSQRPNPNRIDLPATQNINSTESVREQISALSLKPPPPPPSTDRSFNRLESVAKSVTKLVPVVEPHAYIPDQTNTCPIESRKLSWEANFNQEFPVPEITGSPIVPSNWTQQFAVTPSEQTLRLQSSTQCTDPTKFGHRRFPSDTHDLNRSEKQDLRHVQSLASLCTIQSIGQEDSPSNQNPLNQSDVSTPWAKGNNWDPSDLKNSTHQPQMQPLSLSSSPSLSSLSEHKLGHSEYGQSKVGSERMDGFSDPKNDDDLFGAAFDAIRSHHQFS